MDKPEAQRLGWKIVDTTIPFSNPWITLRSDQLKIPNRGEVNYTYLQSPGGVLVVPVTTDKKILLIRQYRYPVDAWCYEVPAGGMNDEFSPEKVAAKELAEEAGARCQEAIVVGKFFVSNSLLDEVCHVVVATGVEVDSAQRLEIAEFIEVHPVSVPDALRMARTGEIQDGKSALAILMSEPYLLDAHLI
jgi:ADP-ribose pyrophosphatase